MEFKYEVGPIGVWLIPCLKDNYIFVIHHSGVNKTIVVDPCESDKVREFLKNHSWNLDEVWITHHHNDHIGGVRELKELFSPLIRGSQQIPGRIPGVTTTMTASSHWNLGAFDISVLELPGHTHDHIAFWVRDQRHSLLFSGDVLFGLGCGRLFEGTYEEMFTSLEKVSSLPSTTKIFCSHEYTELNLEFSLQMAPDLMPLQMRAIEIRERRGQGIPTVPLTLSEELATNLFLRALKAPSPREEFQTLRDSRNKF